MFTKLSEPCVVVVVVVAIVVVIVVAIVVVVVVVLVVVLVVVVVVLDSTLTHVSVHTRTIRLKINWHAHDWWPDTWEKLPASDNPEERENGLKWAKKPSLPS